MTYIFIHLWLTKAYMHVLCIRKMYSILCITTLIQQWCLNSRLCVKQIGFVFHKWVYVFFVHLIWLWLINFWTSSEMSKDINLFQRTYLLQFPESWIYLMQNLNVLPLKATTLTVDFDRYKISIISYRFCNEWSLQGVESHLTVLSILFF